VAGTGLSLCGRAALAPEARLLLCAARLALDHERRAEFQALLRGPLDWPRVLALASAHGLVPLLYGHAEDVAPDAVPAGAMASLWGAQEIIARRNHALARELLRVVRLLERHRVACIPYKGPTLAEALYGSVCSRHFSDLDILVRREDLPNARDLLAAAGYAPAEPLSARAEAALLRSPLHYHAAWLHTRTGAAVELHWRTDPRCAVEDFCPGLWGRPAEARCVGEPVRAFRDSELLLILAVHGSKHHWTSLGWLVDVAELLRKGGHDWDWIWVVAGELRARRRLALGLWLARALLDCALPPEVARQVDAAGVSRLGAELAGRIVQPPERRPMERTVLDMRLCDSPHGALRVLGQALFAPSLNEVARWPLPPALAFLYAPLRIGRLAGRRLSPASRGGAGLASPPQAPVPSHR
jgi:hypothetical protein